MKKIFTLNLLLIAFSTQMVNGQVNINLESNLPPEGDVAFSENEWGTYLLDGDVNGRNIRLGVSNDKFSRAEIKIENNNEPWGKIWFKTTDTSGGVLPRMVIDGGGNVGIGTTNPGIINTNPAHQLYGPDSRVFEVLGGANQGWVSVGSNMNNGPLGGISFTKSNGQSDAHRQVAFIRVNTEQSSYNTPRSTMEFCTKGSGSFGDPDMVITPSGNVGIGTLSPCASCKLDVGGKIRAEEIKVEVTGAPDYVFADNYELSTLEETASYIEENHHLPEIPSAKEMEAHGVNLGEMNMLLLKKIEELTLHLIEKDAQINRILLKLEEQQHEINQIKL